MRVLALFVLILFTATHVAAQSEIEQIGASIQKYIDGTSLNDPDLISEAFYEEAFLFLSKEGHDIWLVPIAEYAAGFNRGERGTPNGRTGRVLSIEHYNDIALATAEITIASANLKFIDVFILKRLDGAWKVISKAATRVE